MYKVGECGHALWKEESQYYLNSEKPVTVNAQRNHTCWFSVMNALKICM